MNKLKKLVAIVCILAMAALTLTACGNKLSGTYVSVDGEDVGGTLTFSGDELTMSIFGIDIHGTYEIDGDEFTMTYNIMGEEVSETMEFSKSGSSIFLDGDEYKKK